MKNFHKQTDYWKPCRPGMIRDISDSKYVRDRRRFIVRTAMGTVVAGLGTFTCLFAINHENRQRGEAVQLSDANSSKTDVPTNAPNVTQIRFSCVDIMERLDEYVADVKIDRNELSVDQRVFLANFKQHLGVCKMCSGMVDDALNA